MKIIVNTIQPVDSSAFKNELVKAFVDTYVRDGVHPSRGVVVVIASTAGGKSQKVAELNETLSARDNIKLAHFAYGEPTLDKYSYQLSAPPFLTEKQLVGGVMDALGQGTTHIIIDSIRLMQYKQDGAATSGGMSTGTFELLTHLTTICYDRGVTLFLPLNPNVKDDLYPTIRKNIEGSVHTIIDLEENTMVARELDRTSIKYNSAADFIHAFYSEATVGKAKQDYELRRHTHGTISEIETVSSRLVGAVSPEDATQRPNQAVSPGISIKQAKGKF